MNEQQILKMTASIGALSILIQELFSLELARQPQPAAALGLYQEKWKQEIIPMRADGVDPAQLDHLSQLVTEEIQALLQRVKITLARVNG